MNYFDTKGDNDEGDDGEEEKISIPITTDDHLLYSRLDVCLTKKLPTFSRSFIKKLFEEGQIILRQEDHSSEFASKKLELKKLPPAGSFLEISIPPPIPLEAVPENIPLEILFEDEHLLIINKPPGLVVHPAPGNYQGTLVNAVLYHCKNLKGIGNVKRPGIVHRLDKGTSGIMVVAKTQECHEKLVLIFSRHEIERFYETLTYGIPTPPSGTLISHLGRHPQHRKKMAANVKNGKKAITHYKVLSSFPKVSHTELKLETGRTHQIRVHLTYLLNTPILGDPLYANPINQKKELLKYLGEEFSSTFDPYPHPLLHAKTLGFTHPITRKDLYFSAPPPLSFLTLLKILQKGEIKEPHPT